MTGMFPYRDEYRNIAHGAKKSEIEAIKIIAVELSRYVRTTDILIPAPNHNGRADYTKKIAELISELTGAKVSDCLLTQPHEPLYNNKDQELSFSLTAKPKTEGRLLFVDNVYDTGKTFRAAKALLPDIEPLIYATTKTIIPPIGLPMDSFQISTAER